MTFRQVDKLLRKNGWERKSKGNASSHIIYIKGSKSISVPFHTKDLPIGTLKSILKQAGI